MARKISKKHSSGNVRAEGPHPITSGNAKVVYMFESHKSLGKNNNWSQIPVGMSEEGHELRRIADKTTNRQALLHEYLYKIPEPPADFSPLAKAIFTGYHMRMRTKRQAEFAKLELVKNPISVRAEGPHSSGYSRQKPEKN